MDTRRLDLVEPDESLRDAFIDYCQAFRAAGESYRRADFARICGDFGAFVRERRAFARGESLPEGCVPQADYWLMCNGRIVGTTRLRPCLNDRLHAIGGHIGYEVRPDERCQGYATYMLGAMLSKARDLGLDRVLVTCDKDNVASARVIVKNGGVLSNEIDEAGTGKIVQRYWIELSDASRDERCRTSA